MGGRILPLDKYLVCLSAKGAHLHREIQRVRVGSVYEWEEGGEGVRQEEMGGGILVGEEDITRIAGRRISGAV